MAVTNLTYANLSDYATALREMGRVVRAGGQIHIGEATDGTFSELTDVLRETLVQKDREDLVSRLDVMDALFPTGATLRAALEHAGFTKIRASTETFTIPFRNAEEALTDGLVASIYLDEMRKRTELETLIPDLLTHAAATLATYHSNGPLSFTVNATVVSALR
ncbi:MAG: hypothetical protein IPK60_06900 [Sandaracinaceae bacterium]|nr:hypothetical protein [Sandaracinaceae bacterium]